MHLSGDMLGRFQAIYYAITGAWPLIHYRSFEAISGPKREPWLVKMVGALTVVIAAALSSDPHLDAPATRRLAIGSALSYMAVDIWYAGIRRRISPVYLLDALVEGVIIVGHVRGGSRADTAIRVGSSARLSR